jgi:hypothetical protein
MTNVPPASEPSACEARAGTGSGVRAGSRLSRYSRSLSTFPVYPLSRSGNGTLAGVLLAAGGYRLVDTRIWPNEHPVRAPVDPAPDDAVVT